MTEVPIIPAKNKTVCLDVCTVCHFIWFDPHEFEALPKLEQKPTGFEHLSEEARQALARAQLETLRRDTLTPEREALNIAVRWQIALDILWLVIRILARW
jgi:Zn-finger nucleic acid-binding protein